VTVTEIDAVVSEIDIAAAPEIVFAYLVDPDKMVRWMGSRVEVNPQPGGSYALDINAQARARGNYVEVVPHSRVVFTFGWEEDRFVPPGSTTVEITLTPEANGGTHVRLVHRGLASAKSRDEHRQGWLHYLSRLSIAAAGGDPGPDPNSSQGI
jgi:uncharacterized protein YndB with AHSA1/START domain